MSAHIPEVPHNAKGEPVPDTRTGYAVGKGQLRIDRDKEKFELDLSPTQHHIICEAIRWDNETPSILTDSFKAYTFRGDYPALDMVVDALRRFENQKAGLGEDKIAYDARTAFNHARAVVKEEL